MKHTAELTIEVTVRYHRGKKAVKQMILAAQRERDERTDNTRPVEDAEDAIFELIQSAGDDDARFRELKIEIVGLVGGKWATP